MSLPCLGGRGAGPNLSRSGTHSLLHPRHLTPSCFQSICPQTPITPAQEEGSGLGLPLAQSSGRWAARPRCSSHAPQKQVKVRAMWGMPFHGKNPTARAKSPQWPSWDRALLESGGVGLLRGALQGTSPVWTFRGLQGCPRASEQQNPAPLSSHHGFPTPKTTQTSKSGN